VYPGKQRGLGGVWVYTVKDGIGFAGTYIEGVIKIAADPRTGTVSSDQLTHEFAHYWLNTNYGITTHPAKYDSAFANWAYARSME